MRAELCGCARCRERGKKRAVQKNPYITFGKASRERTESERKQRKVRGCLIQGEGEGERTLCTHGDVTGRHARERGTDDASALGCAGYPATTLFTKKKRRSGGNNMTDGPLPGDAAPQL